MRISRFLPVVLAVALAATACADKGGEPTEGPKEQYPRNETLYTQGTMWGPPTSWNVISGNYAQGAVGNIYELLFTFNPETLKLEPWLAESGEWSADLKTFTVKLRDAKWADGEALDAEDVVFTTELGKMPSVPYSNLYNYLEKVEATDAKTVVYTFKDSRVQEFENFIYENPIVPEHIWSKLSNDEITQDPMENPVGSGPYKVEAFDTDRVVYVKRDDYWGKDVLKFDPKPKYLIDLVNTSNEVSMGLLLQNKSDLNNNFIPGITNLVQGNFGIKTYFPEAPYMLAANTAFLVPNNTKFPTSDVNFRKALAYAINTDNIVNNVYGSMVEKADPTGLLPAWKDFRVPTVTGFSYDAEVAAKTLTDAGYVDRDGDGFREGPAGQKIAIKIWVPSGWTDWMEAARSIAKDAQAVGINLVAEFPDYNAMDSAQRIGEYDLVINNNSGLSNTPWTLYNYIFQLPIKETQTGNNYNRTENPEAWALVEELAGIPQDDPKFKETLSKIQDILMTTYPSIPLWYNGAWAQFTTQTWTNWPSSAEGAPHWIPSAWNNYWAEFGSIRLLNDIQLAG